MISQPKGWVQDSQMFAAGLPYVGDSPVITAATSSLPRKFIQPNRGTEVLQLREDCVAMALPTAMRDRMIWQGTVNPIMPSRKWLYLMTRVRDLGLADWRSPKTLEEVFTGIANGSIVLPDDGCRPEDALEILNTVGYPKEEHWPYNGAEEMPPLAAMQHAFDQRGKVKVHACYSIEDVKLAIFHMLGVTDAGVVDKAYEQRPVPGVVWRFGGTSVGGHMRRLVGWDDDLGALVEGGSWGDGDRLIAYEDAADPAVVQSKYAIDWVPSPSEDNPLAGGQ